MQNRAIAVIGYDNAELLEIACITTTLGMANVIGELAQPYQAVIATPGGRPIRCAFNLVLEGHAALERLTGPLDTLIVAGGPGYVSASANRVVLAHVQRLARISRRVASVCTGASVLAAAGLLDGKRAATHWRFAGAIAAQYPKVTVDPVPIYIHEGQIRTAAGVTSALDLALAFVEEDHGAELARQTARDLVTYMQRPGNQAQMSIYTAAPPPDNDLIRRLTDYVHTHLADKMDTATLARVAGVSDRHLARLFSTHVGMTPGHYVRTARVTAAARLLASSSQTIPEVAKACGLGSAETLRRLFVECYKLTPLRYRALSAGTMVTAPWHLSEAEDT